MTESSLTEITEKGEWERFPALKEQGLFLQSFSQKRLYESTGQKTWLMEYRKGELAVRSLVTKVTARRGTFLYLPYGPLLSDSQAKELLPAFFEGLKDLAKGEKASFIRVSPFWLESEENKVLVASLGFKPSPIHMLAETLWLLDIQNKTEEELLQETEKKHRNLIRRAKKDGVEISKTTDSAAIERFLELYWQTKQRHKFVPYPKDYIRNQLKFFAEDDQAVLFEATYQGELIASAIIMYYGKGAAYHHGASSSDPKLRKIPASYLLQWEAILEGKKRDCESYNFWGVAPYTTDEKGKRVYNNPNHPFCGITHFKTGFGGHRKDLLPCQDLVLSPKYYFTRAIESYRKWKRGF